MPAQGNFDLVVIGAGINGAGVAQAAAAAGYRVLVLERHAVASATSGASSKLIHGGLRYLETASFGLVRESLRERALLLKNAPDLVHLRRFNIPVYATSTRPAWMIAAGLGLYALTGGLGKSVRFSRVPPSQWQDLDGLKTAGLQSVFSYFDAQTDDVALTQAVMNSARAFGAELLCPAQFESAALDEMGCAIRYTERGETHECVSHVLINAAGPWVDSVLEGITPQPPRMDFAWVQGAHLLIDMPLQQCYYLEAPDQRDVFISPWRGKALVGTTETAFQGDPGKVAVLDEEREYLLGVARQYFPDHSAEVVDSFAGLRVLPAGTGGLHARSREVVLQANNLSHPQVLSVYGGKLTVYRATAQQVLRAVAASLPRRERIADTAKLKLT